MKKITTWNSLLYKDQNYIIPNIKFNHNIETNPFKDDVQKDYDEWIVKNNIKDNNINEGLDFSYAVFPKCGKRELLYLSKIIKLLFLMDDKLIESVEFKNHISLNGLSIPKYFENLYSEDGIHDRYGKMFWEIIKDLKEYGISNEAIGEALKILLESSLPSFKGNPITNETTFEDYHEYRVLDSGTLSIPNIYIYLTSLKKYTLTKEIKDSELFKQFTRAYAIVNYLVNDVVSFPKEMDENRLSNYVKILVIQNSSIQQAINKTMEIVYEKEKLMLELKDKLFYQYPNNPTLQIYIDVCLSLSYGNVLFSFETSRYITPKVYQYFEKSIFDKVGSSNQ